MCFSEARRLRPGMPVIVTSALDADAADASLRWAEGRSLYAEALSPRHAAGVGEEFFRPAVSVRSARQSERDSSSEFPDGSNISKVAP